MPGTGIDRDTGLPITGLDHVKQSFGVLISTRFGSRVMRRLFGSNVPPLLGRNIVPSTFLRFAAAIIVAVELWEPRLRIAQVTFPGEANSPEKIRKGQVGMAVLAQYRPRGHLGDMTPQGRLMTLFF